MRAKITINILEQLTKMVPTWSAVFEISITSEPWAPNWSNKNASKQHQKYDRKLMKMVQKWSQNLSKIDPGGALEATWEPPLKQGASKTSFLTILAPFWDPLWDQFGLMLGIIF